MADPSPEELARFMAAIRQRESSNNYRAESPHNPGWGSAKGAYQFIDATWGGYGGYANAMIAPPNVQDDRARQLMSQYYRTYGSWDLVAIAWHAGAGSANRVMEAGVDPNQFGDILGTRTGDYANQVLNIAGLGAGGASPTASNQVWNGAVMTTEDEDSWVILKDQLASYGLSELYDFAYEQIVAGSSPASILIQLRQEEAYKERFKGMEERRANGYGPITEADYIANERKYRTLLEQAGLPLELFGRQEDFEAYIANDVSPDELEWRVGRD